ncbi:hypothetical protein M9H77_02739 [Catharanthus roseus]|uniref:Uncharacterized protein n=1 Tax=Catharanthus roseus TaxID=4058 RepID=A0ACC0C9B5_CATRO|nr:hypothetical protein M9H77_02739 [Catharanthus roseus]
MALIMRKFKTFYKKGFNNRGKKPPLKKGGQTNCPKAIEKEKGALEAKLEALKKKKKGKGLIGTWDQDSSESEEEEKANICFMALENEAQSSPPNSSNLIDDICDDDPCTMLIEMYGECEKRLCKKIHTLEKSMVDYDVLKEKNKRSTFEVSSLHSLKEKDLVDEGKMKEKDQAIPRSNHWRH